jgi:hypothetical protein
MELLEKLLSGTPEAQKQISNEKNFTFLSDEAKAPGG